MIKIYPILIAGLCCLLCACSPKKQAGYIDQKQIAITTDSLYSKFPNDKEIFDRSLPQVAKLWTKADGSPEEFTKFCLLYFKPEGKEREVLLKKMEDNFEKLIGNYNKLNTELQEPLLLDRGEVDEIDILFGSYTSASHLEEDFFANKLAFICILNFPNYSLEEKNSLGGQWSRYHWACARMGDMFTSRIPSALVLKQMENFTRVGKYIDEYNIYMGKLINKQGERLFPADLRLITHWGLRDELKSNYAEGEKGLEKQEMIYSVMKRIIDQSIPQEVINQDKYLWNPVENKLFEEGKSLSFASENNQRYAYMKKAYEIEREIDGYCQANTLMLRRFNQDLEMSEGEVEKIFIDFMTSPAIKQCAAQVKLRLGRELKAFDIWYGFKSEQNLPEDLLSQKTRALYPTAEAFERGIPLILTKLGFPIPEAHRIASFIKVDASRGAGHALQSEMKSEKARLRTRVNKDGMDYKGYNIAIHELGHNVEQVISIQDVGHWSLRGVPNTGFTEALAFLFQSKDVYLLGFPQASDDQTKNWAKIWSCYEIMGVSLVDMKVWNWMYTQEKFTEEELKQNIIRIAKEVWNLYYAPIFGTKDEPILAVYSHMVLDPLYLPAYPIGQLIDHQIGNYFKNKDLYTETIRIFSLGKLTPQHWMSQAINEKISPNALLNAVK